jgi:membrane-associated phospholipid phosphatase
MALHESATLPRYLGASPRTRRAALLALGVVGTVLAVVCARHDLALSLALVDPGARWAGFAERYGELPGFWAVAAAFSLTFLRAAPGSRQRLVCWLAATVTLTLALGTSYLRLLGETPTPPALALTAALSFALFGLCSRAMMGRAWTLHDGARRASRATVWLALASLLFVHPLKLLWGRVRFRDLDAAHAAFSDWYSPQGFTGHASFPSGHAAMAWMLLPCVLLAARGTRARLMLTLLVVAWGTFVALGRVVIGAHYASDVLWSTLFALAVVLCTPEGEGPASRVRSAR